VGHNEFRVYPPVNEDSAIAVTMTSEFGLLARKILQDGTNATFPSETGVLGRAVGAAMDSEFGILGRVVTTGAPQFTLWIVEGTPDIVADGDDIPIPDSFYLAPLYYALHETYSEIGDHYNEQLAGYYAARYESEITMASEMMSSYLSQALVGIGSNSPWGTSGDTTLPSVVSNEGVDHTVMWPRHCGADDYDGYYDF
jgi:hypothetical protein